MQLLDLMKKYCEHLFESNEPESKAVYQALLPAVICCEIRLGDAIECDTEDLVKYVANFIRTFGEVVLTGEQLNIIVEDTVEFIVKAILAQKGVANENEETKPSYS